MRPNLSALLVVVASATAAHADTEPERLTFEQLLERASTSSRAQMARAETAVARARVEEADAARLPTLSATAFLAPSPDIDCVDPECTMTDPEDFALRLSGAFGGGTLQITQP